MIPAQTPSPNLRQSMKIWLFNICALTILISGCNDSETDPNKDADKNTTDPPVQAAENDNGKTPENPVTNPESNPNNVIEKETVVGRWMLMATTQNRRTGAFARQPLAIFVFSHEEGGSYKAELVESRILADGKLEFADVKPNQFSLLLTDDSSKLNVQGNLRGEKIVCSVKSSDFDDRAFTMTMHPTEVESLQDSEMEELENGSELAEALQSDNPVDGVRKFGKKYPQDALAIVGYRAILDSFATSENIPAEQIHEVVKEYQAAAANWDERIERQAIFDAGYLLATNGYDPEVALKYLDEAENQLAEEDLETRKPMIAEARTAAKGEAARRQLKSTDPAEAAAGYEALSDINKQTPFDHKNLYALAQHAEKNDKVDDALGYYGQLAALPNLELFLLQYLQEQVSIEPESPSAAVNRLWEQKHGNTDGVDDYLKQVYAEQIYGFAEEKAPPSEEGNQVVLAELFTGTACPPCMAADVALGGIEHYYDALDVVALRYHLHIPRPDPLTNSATEARQGYYRPQGTPSMFLNGGDSPFVGGFTMSDAKQGYEKLQDAIRPLLAQETSVSIDATAELNDETLDIAVKATGFDAANEGLRLRLVLAEDLIGYHARNGVRLHEMVVRTMPGGAEGIAAIDGKLEFVSSIPLNSIKKEIEDYLEAFNAMSPFMAFRETPTDMKKMTLVAFVQDDATREVLQTVALPIDGEFVYPEIPEFEPATTPPAPPLPENDKSTNPELKTSDESTESSKEPSTTEEPAKDESPKADSETEPKSTETSPSEEESTETGSDVPPALPVPE